MSNSESASSWVSTSLSESMNHSEKRSAANSLSVEKSKQPSAQEQSKDETNKAKELFDQIVPNGTEVKVDSKTNELVFTMKSGVAPSTALIHAAQKYAAANDLVAYFSVRGANGKSTKVNVSADPDINREDFEDKINNLETPKTPTSVYVAVPDEVQNDATYKANAITNGTYAEVTTYEELRAAWSNANITYIDITAKITYSTGAMSARANGASVIVQGNNNIVDLGTQTFNWGYITNSTTFTLSNVQAQQGFAVNDGNGYSLINPSSATQLTANVNNVTLSASELNGNNPIHLMYGVGSKVVFSGTNVFNISNEVTRSVGSINFANNSSVTLNRTSNDIGFSQFYFETRAAAGSVGYGNTITMGDGSSNTARTYNGQAASYPAMYYLIDGVTVGDNVSWTQTGFQYFINGQQGSSATAKFVFGQNFNLSIPQSTQPGAIRIQGTQSVVFNAGTTLDINHWANGAVIQMNSAGSSVTFISPKKLHMAVNTSSGAPSTGPLVSGAGTFTMNNSQISTWQGTDSQATNPAGNRNLKFTNMTIRNGVTTVTDTAGNVTTSNIVDSSTRELTTVAIDPGTVKLKYVDQYGNVIKTIDVPIDPDVNYIGQYINLVNKDYALDNMPPNYMWAIASQVPASALSDKQSGGDDTTTADDGDAYGQANVAIVPMEGSEYVYNIYVYGVANNNIQYQYVDAKTGMVVSADYLSSGQEAAGSNLPPANYGNVIDWLNSYYTTTNVAPGYHYATGSELNGFVQPTTTTVGTEASLVTIYVTADIQTVNITFVNSDGTALVGQVPNVSINGTSGAEISYADLVVGYLTQAGYYADANGTFTFDFTANGTSTTDSDPQTLTITLYPDYQLAGIISNNQPATDPATGNPYTQIPTSVSEGQYGVAGVSNGTIVLGVTDADLVRNGYIYTITGPDGQVYATLAEALASNSIFDTTTNNGLSIDGAPQSFVVNYELYPVS